MMIKKILTLFILLSLILTSLPAQELGEFEDSFNNVESNDEDEKGKEKGNNNGSWDDEEDSGLGDLLFEIFGRLLWYSILGGGFYSQARMEPPYPEFPHPRVVGDPLIAILRSDTSFHYLNNELFALDERIEIGYGAFGIAGRYSYFFETDRPSYLHLWEAHLLYRMSIANIIELSPGLGGFGMEGTSKSTGFSLTCPLRLNFPGALSLELLSTWNFYSQGSVGSDLDAGLLLDLSTIKPKVGYRRYRSSGGSTLHAAYAGFSMVY